MNGKWNQRLQNTYWAFRLVSKRVGSGNYRQADRAARLYQNLRLWLADNQPQDGSIRRLR